MAKFQRPASDLPASFVKRCLRLHSGAPCTSPLAVLQFQFLRQRAAACQKSFRFEAAFVEINAWRQKPLFLACPAAIGLGHCPAYQIGSRLNNGAYDGAALLAVAAAGCAASEQKSSPPLFQHMPCHPMEKLHGCAECRLSRLNAAFECVGSAIAHNLDIESRLMEEC